jgi:hypothetical protein
MSAPKVDVLADKWPVRVAPCGHGRWSFVAGPRSGSGYLSKADAQEAWNIARKKAIAKEAARIGGAA